MQIPSIFDKNRLLITVLLPVVFVGVLVSGFVIWHLTPPLTTALRTQTEQALIHTSEMAVAICEERFNDLLELRMENNAEMNAAFRREAIQQIASIRTINPHIRFLLMVNETEVLKTTLEDAPGMLHLPNLQASEGRIVETVINGEAVRTFTRYFPFWRMHIVSLISEEHFRAPVVQAQKIVLFGTFGVLLAVLCTLLLAFHWRINRPLQKIIAATQGVARGSLKPAEVHGRDEIAEVGRAFNVMVGSLADEQQKIRRILGELRDSEEQYRMLTEHTLAFIAVVQADRFLFINSRMLEALGRERTWMQAQLLTFHAHEEDRQRLHDAIQALEEGRAQERHLECRLRTAAGAFLWVELQANLILYRETPAVLLHGIDISVRKHAQEEQEKLEFQLSQAKKMEAIGTLAGGVAHDLNNILSGLVGYPELLMLKLAKDDPMSRNLAVIRDSGRKAAAIVQDLLTLARRGVAIEEVVNWNSIVSDHFQSPEHESLQQRYPEIVFEVGLEEGLMNITASPIHLAKSIMNLIANAAESIAGAGKVVVTTSNIHFDAPYAGYETVPAGDYVCLAVEDDGEGIAANDLNQIFEPFYTKKVMKHSGTGLGMTVVWGTTHDYNGYIDIASAPGRGTTVSLYFPVTREAVSEQSEAEGDIGEYAGQGESVLLVDDVPEQLQLLEEMLLHLNYVPFKAASGEQAVERIREQPVDLVLLDMIMTPGIDGLETYRRILALRPGQKAIIASGFSETERVQEALRLGACAYVRKPFTLINISRAIREALDR